LRVGPDGQARRPLSSGATGWRDFAILDLRAEEETDLAALDRVGLSPE
jgi:hypothetical protein